MPCKTVFIDSSETAALLMNSGKQSIEICKNLVWLGRAGIINQNNIRIAYISGIDSDILGAEVQSSDAKLTYLGNYFTQSDIHKVISQFKLD